MPRERLDDAAVVEESSNYFVDQKSPLEFIPTGAVVLDCVLGGGWPLGRVANLVGDSSSGKTLLAIEAMANFAKKWPRGRIFYRESESAFDDDYAAALGIPVDRVERLAPDEFATVEDFFEDLGRCIDETRKAHIPSIYICDSLDALADEAELKLKFNEGSYGGTKPKQLGKLFRQKVSDVEASQMCLIIISQTRSKIGSMFPQKTRSGGDALNFYASQILWLSHLGDVEKTRGGVKRVTGIDIRAKCTKSKISIPRRTCDFTITFGHGIDDMLSSLDFLEGVKAWDEVFDVKRDTYKKHLASMSDDEYWDEVDRVAVEVKRIWRDIERRFMDEVRTKRR